MSCGTGLGAGGAAPTVVTVADRPDLVEPAWQATRDLLREYNDHGDAMNRYRPADR
jgi:hypothetical protein